MSVTVVSDEELPQYLPYLIGAIIGFLVATGLMGSVYIRSKMIKNKAEGRQIENISKKSDSKNENK